MTLTPEEIKIVRGLLEKASFGIALAKAAADLYERTGIAMGITPPPKIIQEAAAMEGCK